jgi:hypothetical protein
VLEPFAATGLLAILAELSGGSLILNELAETRAGLLGHLFPGVAITRFDAAHIHDHLDVGINPSVVLMNPPFSALVNVDRRMADAALRHVASALARIAEGGRLVAITGANCAPDKPSWTDAFVHLPATVGRLQLLLHVLVARELVEAGNEGAIAHRGATEIDVDDRVRATGAQALAQSEARQNASELHCRGNRGAVRCP